MPISASHITYLHLCHRKLWLHHRQIRMEDNSADVAIGKLIDKTSYRRRARKWTQLAFDGIKIDHFDARQWVVMETKKSPKLEHVHVAQVKYYLYRLEQRGVEGVSGRIEYPHQKRTVNVLLNDGDRSSTIPGWLAEIERITQLESCPELVKKSYCRNCAFYDFCFC